jgi:molybdopterin synthase sulfur carrier subunit
LKIRILFFASLREQLGAAAEEIELPAQIATVSALRAHLRARGGEYAKAFSDKSLVRIAVNQEMVSPANALKQGDEVAFFPPVTGG